MNQKVRRQIKRLYRYLLRISSFSLAGASKRGGLNSGMACVPFHQNGSLPYAKGPESENIMIGRFAIFDRFIGSLQAGGAACGKAVFIYEFRNHECEIFSSKRSAVNKASKRHDRNVERSRKKGFDVLRVTLNLARGNIETNAVWPALARA